MTSRLSRLLRLKQRDERGVAALEFALIAPLFIVIGLMTADIGGGVYQKLKLTEAAGLAAQYALRAPSDSGGITATIANALPGWSDVIISPVAYRCACAGASMTDCESQCSTAVEHYVTVTVTKPFNPLLLKDTVILSSATVRTQ